MKILPIALAGIGKSSTLIGRMLNHPSRLHVLPEQFLTGTSNAPVKTSGKDIRVPVLFWQNRGIDRRVRCSGISPKPEGLVVQVK